MVEKESRRTVGLFLFIALRWMQRPERVMVGLTENIQACLRDFLAGTASMARKRLLHQAQGVYSVFVLWHHKSTLMKNPSCGVLPSRQRLHIELYTEGVAPGYSE